MATFPPLPANLDRHPTAARSLPPPGRPATWLLGRPTTLDRRHLAIGGASWRLLFVTSSPPPARAPRPPCASAPLLVPPGRAGGQAGGRAWRRRAMGRTLRPGGWGGGRGGRREGKGGVAKRTATRSAGRDRCVCPHHPCCLALSQAKSRERHPRLDVCFSLSNGGCGGGGVGGGRCKEQMGRARRPCDALTAPWRSIPVGRQGGAPRPLSADALPWYASQWAASATATNAWESDPTAANAFMASPLFHPPRAPLYIFSRCALQDRQHGAKPPAATHVGSSGGRADRVEGRGKGGARSPGGEARAGGPVGGRAREYQTRDGPHRRCGTQNERGNKE